MLIRMPPFFLFSRQPPARISLAEGGNPFGSAIDDAQAIEVAAVVGGELRDELRAPDGGEAMVGVVSGEAGEACVDEADVVADIRHFMNLDVAGYVSGAGEVAGIVLAGRVELCGDSRNVAEFPDVDRGANREATGGDRHAHRFVECAEMRVDDAGVGAEDDQFASLVSGDEE